MKSRQAAGTRYSEAEDALIVRLRDVDRLHWQGIADSLTGRRVSGQAIQYHYGQIKEREERAAAAAKIAARCKTRSCLSCSKEFRSEGPHNRMCDPCRLGAEDVSAFEPDYLGGDDGGRVVLVGLEAGAFRDTPYRPRSTGQMRR